MTSPALDGIRSSLGATATPLHHLSRLTEFLAGPPVYVKRDDLSGLAAGGNKARKLRALLPDAIRRGATVVLTQGGPQSNHCSQTALAAAMAGLRCELFVWGDEPAARTGNLRVEDLVGPRFHYVGDRTTADVDSLVAARARELVASGERPYVIGVGGSDPIGVRGAATVALELEDQTIDLKAPIRVVVAAGSMGTMAGLVLGSWAIDRPWFVDGVSVFMPAPDAAIRLENLLAASRGAICPKCTPKSNYRLIADQLGRGYGKPTEAGRDAQRLLAGLEGLILDLTYTAKAMAGLIGAMRAGDYDDDGAVVFWHTGGLAGFFS